MADESGNILKELPLLQLTNGLREEIGGQRGAIEVRGHRERLRVRKCCRRRPRELRKGLRCASLIFRRDHGDARLRRSLVIFPCGLDELGREDSRHVGRAPLPKLPLRRTLITAQRVGRFHAFHEAYLCSSGRPIVA